MINLKFKIIDLECTACVKLCTLALQKIPGVKKVDINLESGAADLAADREIAWPEIINSLESAGKHAQMLDN